MTYRSMRGYVPLRTSHKTARVWATAPGCVTPRHAYSRQGGEMACACGKRWPIGEDHP